MAKPKPGGRRPRKRERKNVTVGVVTSELFKTDREITDTGAAFRGPSGGSVSTSKRRRYAQMEQRNLRAAWIFQVECR